MSVSADIRAALQTQLDAMASGAGLAVAWDGESFVPAAGLYLRAQLFRSTTSRPFLAAGGAHLHLGFLQVVVMMAMESPSPAINADRIADQVADWFPEDTRLPAAAPIVRIIARPHVAGGYRDEAWWAVPITVNFEATA